jgi:integrase
LRECEIFALRVEDVVIHIAEPYVYVRSGKGRRAGRVPLSRAACGILADWMTVRPPTPVPFLIFQQGDQRGDRAYSPHCFTNAISLLKKLALLPDAEDITAHSLRRFGASQVAQQPGASVADAQKFLRHSSLSTTFRYIKPTSNLSAFVDGILEPPTPPSAPVKPEAKPERGRVPVRVRRRREG